MGCPSATARKRYSFVGGNFEAIGFRSRSYPGVAGAGGRAPPLPRALGKRANARAIRPDRQAARSEAGYA